MDLILNFISFNTLGSFNPAILQPDFLNEQGIYKFDSLISGKVTPVVSELKFKNIEFLAELERFQIMHRAPENILKTPIIEAGFKYLTKLQYTPLFLQGVNFNFQIAEFKRYGNINDIFDSPVKGISNYFGKQTDFSLDTKSKISHGSEIRSIINIKYYIDNGISSSLNFRRNNNDVIINFNYEVEELKKDRSRIKIICENYSSVVEKFKTFLYYIKNEEVV